MASGDRCQGGFTYIALLFAVAIVGVAVAATATIWQLQGQREKEQELLFIGNEFRVAIQRYLASSPAGARRYPTRLADLIIDERFAEKRRHLRRIYVDPMTGRAEWGLVRLKDGQIIGVHSLSEARPIKRAGFRPRDEALAGKERYADWLFVAAPLAAPGVRVAPGRP